MFTEWRDSAGLVAARQGQGPDDGDRRTTTPRRSTKIDEESDKGQIRRFTGNDYTKDLASGNLWACVAWSGDLVQLQADNPNLEFLVPEEGGMSWSDNMLMPANGAKGYYGAETFMNYVYDPQVAATDRRVRQLLLPGHGREGDPRRRDPELANNQLIFPDEQTLSQLHAYPSLGAAPERELTAEMQKVTGA